MQFQDVWKWKSAMPTTSRKAGYAPENFEGWFSKTLKTSSLVSDPSNKTAGMRELQ